MAELPRPAEGEAFSVKAENCMEYPSHWRIDSGLLKLEIC